MAMRLLFKILSFLITIVSYVQAEVKLEQTYYSKNYEEARSRFQTLAEGLKRQNPDVFVWQFQVPSKTDTGLTVDYLYLPAKEKKQHLFVLTSGVHGMEAFAGSAVQLMFLKEFENVFQRKNIGFLLVHSLNPYGFKNSRRATETNVNLNRNFTTSNILFQTKNSGYEKLQALLEPQGPVVNPTFHFLSICTRLIFQLLTGEATVRELTESVSQGQFVSSKGLEFGGHAVEPQIVDFLKTIQKLSSDYSEVILYDLHTGLGDREQLYLMPGNDSGKSNSELFHRIFKREEDQDIYQYTPNTLKGFYHTHGDLNNVLSEIMRPEQKFVSVTLEFGTIGNGIYPKLRSLNRLILENQGAHVGYANQSVEAEVRNDFAELFFPAAERWRKNVIVRSREVFRRTFQRLE